MADPREGRFLEVLKRSALGLIAVYNLLPAEVVEANNVSSFQSRLSALLRSAQQRGCPRWQRLFSPREELARHPLLALLALRLPTPAHTPTTRPRPLTYAGADAAAYAC